jgi:CelD/BcsL family acetyltransferase involved in cellulose biosynthesis
VSGPLRVEIGRTAEQLEALRPAWDELPWEREEAAYPYFTARLRARAGVVGPFAAVVYEGVTPVGGLAARIELRRLEAAVGYRAIYAPTVRVLQVVDGGIAVVSPEAAAALARVVADALGAGDVEVAAVPPLEIGSQLGTAFASLGGPLTRQPLIAPWTRRLLRLPGSFDGFLATRSHKTRKGIRRDARQLEAAFGDALSVEIVREPADADRLVAEVDRVARSSYQRRLGAGFADTAEQRELVRVGLEHGWMRGYLLYLEGKPAAYWLCSPFRRTTLLRTGGFDEAYSEHRVGIYLLMRVIEDSCLDPGLDVLDFGPGDAPYKEQYANEMREERNAVIFAPTFRARRINATRTAILGPTRLAKAALDKTHLTSRVKTRLRRRAT